MQRVTENILTDAAVAIRGMELTPFDLAFNRAIDRIVAFLDRWIFTPFIGAGQSASDF